MAHYLRAMMKRLPISLAAFPLAALFYGLQRSAAHNIGLLLLTTLMLMPWWSIALINGGFLGIAFETFVRKLAPLWLVLPLGWFGFGIAFAAHDRYALNQVRSEVIEANRRNRLTFDPARDTLVVDGSGDPEALLTHYDLHVVYVQRYSGRRPFPWSQDDPAEPPLLAYRLASEDGCDAIRANPLHRQAGVILTGVAASTRDSAWTGPWRCLVVMAAPPLMQPHLVVRKRVEAEMRRVGVPISRVRLAMDATDGRHAVLTTGTASPMPWVPLPLLGCVPRSLSGTESECGEILSRQSERLLRPDDTALLAQALGLRPRTPDSPVLGTDEFAQAIAAAAAYRRSLQLALLDAALAAGHYGQDHLLLRALEGDATALAPRFDRILSLAARTAGRGGREQSLACDAMDLILTLSPADLKPVLPRIRSLARRDTFYAKSYREFAVAAARKGQPVAPLD